MRSLATAAPARRPRAGRLEAAARAGLLAKAVLYGVVGGLALAVAAGAGGRPADQQGALARLADGPLGGVLIGLLATGLAGYGVWRLAQALLDTGGEGDDAKGVATRVGYAGSAAIHLALMAFAIRLLAGGGGGGQGSGQERETTAGVLGWPGGRVLVIAAALLVVGVGAYNVYRGLSGEFLKDLDLRGPVRRPVEWLGVIGHAGRGGVFGLVGAFLMKAAVEHDPGEAEGLDGALARLAGQPYGQAFLGIAAAGLLAFAAYCAADARYRASRRI